MNGRAPTIFLSAAEASGDLHAANLIRALRAKLPESRFVGVAGPRMAEAGCEVLADLTRRADMLLGPVLRLHHYWQTVRRVQRAVRDLRPDLCVATDSPAFNWHVAAAAKEAGSPVLHYVAPQVWAWAPWRVKKLARLTDRVACLLPFEEEYLRSRGVPATFVGHPIFDGAPPVPQPPDLIDAWFHGTWRVALLPGSRPGEIAAHTGAALEVAKAIFRRWPKATCTFALHTEAGAESVRQACECSTGVSPVSTTGILPVESGQACGAETAPRRMGGTPMPQQAMPPQRIGIVAGPNAAEEVLAHSHFAVVCSGTVTLQVARLGVPMVVFYKTGLLVRAMDRALGWSERFVPTKSYVLPNILAGRQIVPELVPWAGDARPLVRTVLEVMSELGHLVEMRENLRTVAGPLAVPPPGSAAENVARIAMELLGRGWSSAHRFRSCSGGAARSVN